MPKKKYTLSLCAFMALFFNYLSFNASAALPVVSNIAAAQRPDTKLVDITYDLADAEGDKCTVRIRISSDGGATYLVPAKTLSGHIGGEIQPGTQRTITWNAGEDWDGEFSDQMKVSIDATDWSIVPGGIEFGNEVKPGGFLMGNSLEESLDVKRITIPYSYWMSKFEITTEQFCHFLNMKIAEGKVTITENRVYSHPSSIIQTTKLLTTLENTHRYGALWQIEGQIIPYISQPKFVLSDAEAALKIPAEATIWGAYMFAKTYGYDLPTEVEWEKAARGPDHDDAGEHFMFPWSENFGIDVNSSWRYGAWGVDLVAVDRQVPGVDPRNNYRNTINGYGMYHVIGNAQEWTMSEFAPIVLCKKIHDPNASRHRLQGDSQVIRGSSSYLGGLNARNRAAERSSYGIRLVRRNLL
jgi:formylglycine-generating enzyme required for sulfatase activity